MTTQQIVLFVGDISIDLSNAAMNFDKNAILLTASNFKNFQSGTYYTSIADMENLSNFAEALALADVIYYCPPSHWSSKKMHEWTEDYLKSFCYYKPIVGFNKPPVPEMYNKMLELVDTRKSNSKQIWIAGCSISHGVGVTKNQKYGEIISQELNLPISYLTQSGSSIQWAADQICRSDIRKDDILFWGITDCFRFTAWDKDSEDIHINLVSYENNKNAKSYFNKKIFTSEILPYLGYTSIHRVLKFCNLVGAKIILGSVMPGFESPLSELNNFVNFTGINDRTKLFLDLGSDGRHPGVKSHQFYASQFLKKYREII